MIRILTCLLLLAYLPAMAPGAQPGIFLAIIDPDEIPFSPTRE